MSERALGLACVAGGGALGAVTRFVLGGLIQGGAAFPRGTLIINVSGCLAFGILSALTADRVSEPMRLLVFTGILGGYTTFSAFGGETLVLARDQPARAAAYVLLSVGLGLAAVAAGYWIGLRLRG